MLIYECPETEFEYSEYVANFGRAVAPEIPVYIHIFDSSLG